jgi:hypothetical protein
MSSSAATPSASSCKATGSGRVSSVEPSPASTYGESAASDAGDGPQTPVGENDGTYLLICCFRTCDPSIPSSSSLSIHPRHPAPTQSPSCHLQSCFPDNGLHFVILIQYHMTLFPSHDFFLLHSSHINRIHYNTTHHSTSHTLQVYMYLLRLLRQRVV